MKILRYPKREYWSNALKRPGTGSREVEVSVLDIIDQVRRDGDTAIRGCTHRFDGVVLDSFRVSENEIRSAEDRVSEELRSAIEAAKENIRKFHALAEREVQTIESVPGVTCWRRGVPIQTVGLYVPGGSAPLFSTVLMLAVPATIAGCRDIVLFSPPDRFGSVAPEILFAARCCGVSEVFRIGGAQAIAAMAYGTASVPRVDKIFGPGNQYVTAAKQLVSKDVAIDMPAGPSELLVIADQSAVPSFVAADLLSQAEHGADSQVVLVSTDEKILNNVLTEIERQLAGLPRKETAQAALEHSVAILKSDTAEAMEISNYYAPEHLILAVEDADSLAGSVVNAGSVFLGNFSCESAGDYASGTNHTLPTAGFARAMGGLSVESFMKPITFQRLTKNGLRNIGPVIQTMAAAEGLEGHRNAVTVRLEAIDGI